MASHAFIASRLPSTWQDIFLPAYIAFYRPYTPDPEALVGTYSMYDPHILDTFHAYFGRCRIPTTEVEPK